MQDANKLKRSSDLQSASEKSSTEATSKSYSESPSTEEVYVDTNTTKYRASTRKKYTDNGKGAGSPKKCLKKKKIKLDTKKRAFTARCHKPVLRNSGSMEYSKNPLEFLKSDLKQSRSSSCYGISGFPTNYRICQELYKTKKYQHEPILYCPENYDSKFIQDSYTCNGFLDNNFEQKSSTNNEDKIYPLFDIFNHIRDINYDNIENNNTDGDTVDEISYPLNELKNIENTEDISENKHRLSNDDSVPKSDEFHNLQILENDRILSPNADSELSQADSKLSDVISQNRQQQILTAKEFTSNWINRFQENYRNWKPNFHDSRFNFPSYKSPFKSKDKFCPHEPKAPILSHDDVSSPQRKIFPNSVTTADRFGSPPLFNSRDRIAAKNKYGSYFHSKCRSKSERDKIQTALTDLKKYILDHNPIITKPSAQYLSGYLNYIRRLQTRMNENKR